MFLRLFDLLKLLLLSAIWGGSFLFMRVAAPEMGPFLLIWLRVGLATVFLSPVLFRRSVRSEILANWKGIVWVGLFNSVTPWCLLAFAVLYLEAGFTSVLNASTPIFSALVGLVWLKESLSKWQSIGLFLGIVGVGILAGGHFSLGSATIVAIVAALVASFCYGYVGHYVNHHLSELSPWAITFGCLASATVLLTPPMLLSLPDAMPSGRSMVCAVALGLLSTAIAFILLFELLGRVGATATSTVTFVIPIFGVLFGCWFLQELLTLRIVIGMVVALTGAALVTRLIPLKSKNNCA